MVEEDQFNQKMLENNSTHKRQRDKQTDRDRDTNKIFTVCVDIVFRFYLQRLLINFLSIHPI